MTRTKQNAEHQHLCPRCSRRFDCQGQDCEEFEIQLCPDCSKLSSDEKGKRRRREAAKKGGTN